MISSDFGSFGKTQQNLSEDNHAYRERIFQ